MIDFLSSDSYLPGCSVSIAPASNEPYAGTDEIVASRATARGHKAATSAQARPHDAFIALR